ncbi:hypothetical protein WI560_06395 [Bradyrhizobium sp. A11]|uniref:hypothetical protein n=1 Tax=Bradyrhizobium sp. A11 TaxID=3133974 RepID=UPI00324588E7
MERAIGDLDQLSDEALFEEISTGINHLIKGIDQLNSAALSLSRGDNEYPAKILGNLAEEEAAKILILVDAVRCPLDRRNDRARQLQYFYRHLPKGIYVEICKWGGILSFAEMKKAVDLERETHYLDGPNDVDWIFRNQILQKREDDLYVDYLRDNDDRRYWTSPVDNVVSSSFPYRSLASPVLHIATALASVGATSVNGLKIIAQIWRPIKMTPNFSIDEIQNLNRDTLLKLEIGGLLRSNAQDDCNTIIQSWPFPLYSLDLHETKVAKSELKDKQRRWQPT